MARIRQGSGASITSAAYPDRVFRGQVTYIDPNINPETRTAQERVELANSGQVLKIGMYVNVAFGALGNAENTMPVVSAIRHPEYKQPAGAFRRNRGAECFRDVLATETTKTINTLKAHLALNVKNVDASIEFYKKMFGIEPSKVRTGYAKFDIQNPPLNLTLNQHPFGEQGALSHLGIQVASTEDVLAMREQWHEQGLLTRDEMDTNCCYAIQDKTWTRDPDGNEWEVFVVKEDNLPEAAERTQSASCCAPSPVGIGGKTQNNTTNYC